MYASPAERHAQPFPGGPAVLVAQRVSWDQPQPDTEGPGLLASPAFWVGGAFSVLCWTGIAMVLLRLF